MYVWLAAVLVFGRKQKKNRTLLLFLYYIWAYIGKSGFWNGNSIIFGLKLKRHEMDIWVFGISNLKIYCNLVNDLVHGNLGLFSKF